jgi:hypothetical protein
LSTEWQAEQPAPAAIASGVAARETAGAITIEATIGTRKAANAVQRDTDFMMFPTTEIDAGQSHRLADTAILLAQRSM